MRIALIAPRCINSRADALLGRTVSVLADELANRGHSVTAVQAEGFGGVTSRLWEGVLDADSQLAVAALMERSVDFDLIHGFIGAAGILSARLVDPAVVATVTREISRAIPAVLEQLDDVVHYVAPSESDIEGDLHFKSLVPWGLAVDRTHFEPTALSHLAFVGEVRPGAGLEDAIEFALETHRKLIVVGTPHDRDWFDKLTAPHRAKDRVAVIEDAGSTQADEAVGKAVGALLVLGEGGISVLAALDAMARGTPILALPASQTPAVLRDFAAGVAYATPRSASEAVASISTLPRADLRAWVGEQYPAGAMALAQEAAYKRIVEFNRRTDRRPWGYYVVLSDEPDHKVKRIVVYPGKRLSLQRHHRRAEHWFVLKGEALVTLNEREIPLGPAQSVEIPMGAWHRVKNPGTADMAFVEVQTGDYFGEDDIERKEDDFGRT